MCGIIGVFNKQRATTDVLQALALLKNRGLDSVGMATQDTLEQSNKVEDLTDFEEPNAIGHRLHAIVDHVSQPLQSEKSIFAANCEIYNWEELNQKYKLNATNDADLLHKFIDKFCVEKLNEIDGVYAFIHWNNNLITITRDILGVKPLFYTITDDSFALASEKKALLKMNFLDVQELSPRKIIIYNIDTKEFKETQKEFFSIKPEHTKSKEEILSEVETLLESAIDKRIPNQKIGVLFSGGIDSTFIAHHLKKRNIPFTCYTTAIESDTVEPEDLTYANLVANEYNFNLKIKIIKIEDIPECLKTLVPLIEDNNVVKVGVALTFYLAAEMAKEDGCKVLFSGLGSEEIFAGYDRHKKSANINQECISGLQKMHERDLYRDDVVTMDNNLELRLPFLDKKLVDYALKIPTEFKIKDGMGKYILREIALLRGIKEKFSFRKKKAAQYGSRIDNALGRLARREKKNKSEYLKQFYPSHNLKLGVLYSGGKDSNYSMHIMHKQNYDIACLITLKSKNPYSYMFQSAGVEITKLQSEALDIPLLTYETEGEKEKELFDLKQALIKAQELHGIQGIVTGALFSTYQRDRIEKICDEVGLTIFSPLWHKGQEQEMNELLNFGFEFIFSAIAAQGLDKTWLNKVITKKELNKLVTLQESIGFNCAGEGGEFESLVLNSPLFKKRIVLDEIEIIEDSPICAYMKVLKAHLEDKE